MAEEAALVLEVVEGSAMEAEVDLALEVEVAEVDLALEVEVALALDMEVVSALASVVEAALALAMEVVAAAG